MIVVFQDNTHLFFQCTAWSVFSAVGIFSLEQLKFLKFTSFCIDILITVFIWSSINKNKFGEIDIFRLQYPLIKLWEVI